MRRSLVLPLALGGVAFLVISLFLARWLTTEGRERDAVSALLRAQARGDERGMLALLDGCAANRACVALQQRNAQRLRRPGRLQILAYDSGTAYALGAARGLTRVAWQVPGRGLPVVQCVLVDRGGTALSRTLTLQRLSAPIGRESPC